MRLRGLQPPGTPLAPAVLPEALAGAGAADLQKHAWARVQPDLAEFPAAAVAEGLAAAERCLLVAGDDPLVRGRAELTLACARLRAGQPDAAELIRAACERVPTERSYFFLEHERRVRELQALVGDPVAVRTGRPAAESLDLANPPSPGPDPRPSTLPGPRVGSAGRITFVVHQFPPRYFTGTEQYALAVGCELQRRGHDVDVFALDPAFGEATGSWRSCAGT